MMKWIKYLGQPLCMALYAFCIYLTSKHKVVPLIVLMGLHFTEYLVVGRKVAKEKKLFPLTGLVHCLVLGFTWWLPVKSELANG